MTEKRFTDIEVGADTGRVRLFNGLDFYEYSPSELLQLLNHLHEENKQLKQYKEAIWNCDSSKIIRVNMNTGEVDLIDKELKK